MGDRPKRKAAQVPSDQPAPQKRKRPVCSLTGFRSDSTPRFGWRTADSAAPRCFPSTCQCVVARRARGLLFPTSPAWRPTCRGSLMKESLISSNVSRDQVNRIMRVFKRRLAGVARCPPMSLFLFLGARCAIRPGCESSETEGSREWSLAKRAMTTNGSPTMVDHTMTRRQ